MEYPEITKPAAEALVAYPNLDRISAQGEPSFDWKQIEEDLGIRDSSEAHQAYLCLDRHAESGKTGTRSPATATRLP
jgi:hypothetical protein